MKVALSMSDSSRLAAEAREPAVMTVKPTPKSGTRAMMDEYAPRSPALVYMIVG